MGIDTLRLENSSLYEKVSIEEHLAAMSFVASRAIDACDARQLLTMLGLWEDETYSA